MSSVRISIGLQTGIVSIPARRIRLTRAEEHSCPFGNYASTARGAFYLDQSNVFRDIRYLEPLVSGCLPRPKKVQKLTRRLRTMEEVEEFFPELKAFVDSTEQEIPRPEKDAKKRKSHYSGKKRKHTVKTQVAVIPWGDKSLDRMKKFRILADEFRNHRKETLEPRESSVISVITQEVYWTMAGRLSESVLS